MLKSSSRATRVVACLGLGASLLYASGAMAKPSWVLFDADNGMILGQDGANVQHAPASLAKMMTLYLAFEALKTGRIHWGDEMPISKNAASKVRMKLWLKPGQTISVRDAIHAMIIISANDAATVLGEYLGGSEANFGRLMTQRARQLGMKSTFFVNPSGLTASETQLSTPRDMSVLGMALRRDFPEDFKLFSTRTYTYHNRVLNGHNTLMYRYQGVDGIKTGYTDVSGYNLVSSAIIDGRHLVGAVMGAGSARERDGTMVKALNKYGKLDAGTLTASVTPSAQDEDDPEAEVVDDSKIEQGDGGNLVASASGTASAAATAGAAIWRVQVGATPSRNGADRLQKEAAPVVAKVLADAKGEILQAGRGKRIVYRVLFNGFSSENQANTACRALTQQQIACLAMRN